MKIRSDGLLATFVSNAEGELPRSTCGLVGRALWMLWNCIAACWIVIGTVYLAYWVFARPEDPNGLLLIGGGTGVSALLLVLCAWVVLETRTGTLIRALRDKVCVPIEWEDA